MPYSLVNFLIDIHTFLSIFAFKSVILLNYETLNMECHRKLSLHVLFGIVPLALLGGMAPRVLAICQKEPVGMNTD